MLSFNSEAGTYNLTYTCIDGVHIVSEPKSVSISVLLLFFMNWGECARASSKFCEVPKVEPLPFTLERVGVLTFVSLTEVSRNVSDLDVFQMRSRSKSRG